MREFLVLVLRAPHGSVVVLAVSVRAVSPVPAHIALLAEAARASVPPQPELPWFTEGEVIEPRQVAPHAAAAGDEMVEVVADEPTPHVRTDAQRVSAIQDEQRWPALSLARERELRELRPFSDLARRAKQLRPSARQTRQARQLREVALLAALLRRARTGR